MTYLSAPPPCGRKSNGRHICLPSQTPSPPTKGCSTSTKLTPPSSLVANRSRPNICASTASWPSSRVRQRQVFGCPRWGHPGHSAGRDCQQAGQQRLQRLITPADEPLKALAATDQFHKLQRVLAGALMAGHTVYLHSYRGTGHAAMAAVAYLVGQGRSPLEAWRFLCQQWAQTTRGPFRRLPDTEGQRRFLLRLTDWL